MISAYILFAFGAILMLLELLFGSFYLLFFGFGFVLIGFIGFFVTISWYLQILLSCVVSLVLIFALKKPLKKSLKSTHKFNENFLNDSGVGEIREGMVYFKGTLWRLDKTYNDKFKDGDMVEIVGVRDGRIILKD